MCFELILKHHYTGGDSLCQGVPAPKFAATLLYNNPTSHLQPDLVSNFISNPSVITLNFCLQYLHIFSSGLYRLYQACLIFLSLNISHQFFCFEFYIWIYLIFY